MVRQDAETRRRLGVAPADLGKPIPARDDIPVFCLSLPFAQRFAGRAFEHAFGNVVGREVVLRRMAGFEHPDRAARVGYHDPAMLDHDMRIGRLRNRGARIVPHAFLPRAGLYWIGPLHGGPSIPARYAL